MDKLDLVLELLKAHKENMNERLESIDDHMFEYNQQLTVHIKRTELLEELHKDNAKRIELLEKPREARQYLKNVVLYIASISGAIITVHKALELLK